MSGKTVRRSIMALWDGDALEVECDRIYIALHRFQTEGKIAYRRLVGVHGGGGGNSDPKFLEILGNSYLQDEL